MNLSQFFAVSGGFIPQLVNKTINDPPYSSSYSIKNYAYVFFNGVFYFEISEVFVYTHPLYICNPDINDSFGGEYPLIYILFYFSLTLIGGTEYEHTLRKL